MRQKRNGSHLILMELMFVLFFFAICGAVLLQVFVKSHNISVKAKELTETKNCVTQAAELFETGYTDIEHYQTIFYLLFRLMGQYVESEVKSSVGRADVVVQLQDVVYVFEFKYDGTPEEALAQIDSKQYAIPYRADGRRVVKIGVNFDSSTRTIGGWKIAKAD